MEKRNITNEENIKNLKKRKILRYILITFYFLTIIMALADLFLQETLLLLITVIFFLITMMLDKYRESIVIIKHDELKEVKEEIENTKKKLNPEITKKNDEPKKKTTSKVASKTKSKTTSNTKSKGKTKTTKK